MSELLRGIFIYFLRWDSKGAEGLEPEFSLSRKLRQPPRDLESARSDHDRLATQTLKHPH